MLLANSEEKRNLKVNEIDAELVIVGGGLSGVCAAVTAARAGVKVVLVQDRPVLGGNASSEVRLWVLGATSHMGNNNRWAREGGVIDELLVENTYRNPEGNPLIFDVILLDLVRAEKNIRLLLNTSVFELDKDGAGQIKSVSGFCSQNSTWYTIKGKLFCDCSGDGILGFLSGAAFRMGAESKDEFGEKFAPSKEYGELLGHSLYFYSKDTGKPVKYIAPDFALDDITRIPRFRSFNAQEFGCKLWWLEYGGRLDTVYDTEEIKWELWKVVYGTWNYIKNSGNFPEAENLTLEWVGTIPGKRESRRFEGDYILTQQDIIEQRSHPDAVAYGGWSIDLHPADGVFSEKPGCNQWHGKGIYQIPYRCLYSRNIPNLLLGGRIISASHVAFASSRVMATSAYAAQAAGLAAALCLQHQVLPAGIINSGLISELQTALQKAGQHIPGLILQDATDLAAKARITASSTLRLSRMDRHTQLMPLEISSAQLIPVRHGQLPAVRFTAEASSACELTVTLRASSKAGNFTPDLVLQEIKVPLEQGMNHPELTFQALAEQDSYLFLCFDKNPAVKLSFTAQRITGMLSVFNLVNKAVSNFGKQTPTEDIGVDEFEFWCPQRRPQGLNLALEFEPPLDSFQVGNVTNGIDRPVLSPNAWVADSGDQDPSLRLKWDEQKSFSSIELVFDCDYDHPMESVLMSHPESVMPFCVRNYRIADGSGNTLFEKSGNYQTRNSITFTTPVHTDELVIHLEHPSELVPAALFAIRCYS